MRKIILTVLFAIAMTAFACKPVLYAKGKTHCSVAVNHVIHRAVVSALENGYMENVGADEDFLRHFHHLVFVAEIVGEEFHHVVGVVYDEHRGQCLAGDALGRRLAGVTHR